MSSAGSTPRASASFSGWAYGRNPAPKTLPPALAEALELDAREAAVLAPAFAPAFAYGQDEPIFSDEHGGAAEEHASADTRGVAQGAGGEGLGAREGLTVLDTFGQEGARMYLFSVLEGEAYRHREDGR